MNNKEKNIENNNQPPVFVDTAKMLQGMSLVFSGAIKMLEALGSSITFNADTIRQALTVGSQPDTEKNDAQTKADDTTKAAEHGCSNMKTPIDTSATVQQTEQDQCNNDSTAITIDEITKVILGKIKLNKENSDKIGLLVSSYGVSKVKDLPSEKYEAFVTDLASI